MGRGGTDVHTNNRLPPGDKISGLDTAAEIRFTLYGMESELSGKVGIVTGAGVGIGYEICRQLAASGAKVVLNDVDPELTAKAAAAIETEFGNCAPLAGDAGDPDVIGAMVDTAVSRFGGLDWAVANAGITLFGNFFEYSPQQFERVTRTNLGGSFFLAQAAARQMSKQGNGGSIVFMSSVLGQRACKDHAAYAMTKAGLEMLARNLIVELAPLGINVNTVAPGATATERTLGYGDYRKEWGEVTPSGRVAETTDIAAAVLFLLTPRARHITGQNLTIDGGWTAVSPAP